MNKKYCLIASLLAVLSFNSAYAFKLVLKNTSHVSPGSYSNAVFDVNNQLYSVSARGKETFPMPAHGDVTVKISSIQLDGKYIDPSLFTLCGITTMKNLHSRDIFTVTLLANQNPITDKTIFNCVYSIKQAKN